jgi:Methyl-accepting chemotaxis protein (MCP) signalling domain
MASENFEIVQLTREVHRIATGKVSDINEINREATFLAINALIESARAGEAGRGFAVVAGQVKVVSHKIGQLTSELNRELTALGDRMISQLQHQEAQRLTDLAFNMIEIMDRNLYERSCDVRWWATDAALTDCAAQPVDANIAHACQRLGVILDSYTVYLDLWVIDLQGNVIANGRPSQYGVAGKHSVARSSWFADALKTRSGADYTAADVETVPALGNARVLTYATAIREGGQTQGPPIGVLAVFFDWTPQASAIVKGVRLSDEDRKRSRCMLIDSRQRVIASSDERGGPNETFALQRHAEQRSGHYTAANGALVAFAETPGYETYRGMGWLGVIEQVAAK